LLTEEVVATAHRAGYRVATWTVNEPERAQQLFGWGVDTVITDAVDSLPPDAA
jgi:glycerophosphoryl diester phosphodiesterase